MSEPVVLEGEACLLRVFVGSRDLRNGRNVFEVIIEEAKAAHLAGATVFSGFLGYGSHAAIHHTGLFHFSEDLPVLVEIVDLPEKIEAFLPRLEELLAGGGLITREKVTVVHYEAPAP